MHKFAPNVTYTYQLGRAANIKSVYFWTHTHTFAACTNSDPLIWAVWDYPTIERMFVRGQKDELEAPLLLCIFPQRH